MPGRVVLSDREAAAWLKRLAADPSAPPPTPDEVTAASVGRRPPSSPHAGKRADLGGLFVRSAWESNFCRYLNYLQAHDQITGWAYEPETFTFPVRRGPASFYTPDFKVWDPDRRIVYYEVKGWMSPTSAAKLKRFARYYPALRLVLVDADAYHALARDVAPLIPTWEHNR
jgi:hypothetical protein